MANKWVGFPNTSGTPSSPVGSWANYSNPEDRIYGLQWTASENGTIGRLNIRFCPSPNNVYGPNGCFAVVYNGGTKVGQSAITPSDDAWVEVDISVVSGQSLDFSTNDVLVFGLAFDGGGGSGGGIREDDGSSYSPNNQYAVETVGASGPDTSASFSTSGSHVGGACILRYDDGASSDLTVPDLAIATTIDNIVITPAQLTVPDLTVASTIDNIVLTEDTLVVSDLAIASTIDNVVLESLTVTLASSFESGNGVEAGTFESPSGTFNIVTECDPSPADTSWGDWFYFSLDEVQGKAPIVKVDFNNDRGGGPYWNTHSDVRPVYSYDQVTWYRLSSIGSYTSEILTFTLPTMTSNKVYVAMDHPYTYSDLVSDYATWSASGYTAAEVLGSSQGSRNIYYLKIEESGFHTNRFEMVITGRAHPGEPQASHAMKGFLDWIISADADAVEFRRKSILYVFPMVNPDGVHAGRLRSFNDGSDGNRGWDITGPDSGSEPAETFLIHTKIHTVNSNVLVCIDFHSNNYASPRMVYDATYDDWVTAELNSIVTALNANDTDNYFYDSAYNMVTAYTTNFRRGQIEQYGYNALGLEGGIYAMESNAWPTVTQRETGGGVLIESIIEAMEAAGAPYVLTADAGTFTLSGTSANIFLNRLLSTDAGTFSLTGQDINLLLDRLLTANSGSFTLTGQNVDLLFNRLLSAESGSFSLSGVNVNLLLDRLLGAEAGSFVLTGTDVNLNYSGTATYTLTADPGSFSLSGTNASLLLDRLLGADAGAFSLTGQDASLLLNRLLSAGSGSFVLTGQDVSLIMNRLLSAEAGSFSLAGQDAGLFINRLLNAEAGSFALTGQDVTLLANRVLGAEAGSFSLVGQDVTFEWSGDTLAVGKLTITFTPRKPGHTFTPRKPTITFS